MDDPKIAIIGTGSVGAALGGRLHDAGYDVTFGARDVARARGRVHERIAVATPIEAAAKASLLFLAVPGPAAPTAATTLGDVDGKILVDCNNPIRWDDGPVWDPPAEGSIAEAIAASRPRLRVIKAFNAFGAEFHADPSLHGDPVDVFMAGDDLEAKQILQSVAARAGFHPIDAGPLRNARLLENLAVLWIHLAMVEKHGRDVAFKLASRG